MDGIFGKPSKRAFHTCMGHGGVSGLQKKLFNVNCRQVRDFPPILSQPTRILTRPGSYFQPHCQVFSPSPLQKVGIGSNQGQKWIQHPHNRGIPCCKPLGPNFVDPKAPLPGPAAGTGPRQARARFLALGSTRDPYRRARQGGLWVNKSGSHGLTPSYPPILRIPNPFLALV